MGTLTLRLLNSLRQPPRDSTWVRPGRAAHWWPVWTWLGVLVIATAFLLHPLHQHLPASVLASARWLGRDWLATLYFLLAGMAFLVYYLPRRGESRPFALSAGAVGTVLASILGLGTFVPCLPTTTPWWSSIYHTMALFVGSVHEPFGDEGSSCPTMPVSLEVARILALGVALGALVAVLMRLFVEQVDRLRVRFAHRIVLVTGLTEDTQEFVLRLRQMYDGGPRSEEFANSPESREPAARWLKDEYRQAAHIVVVEPNRAHPLVARLRQAGVRVVTADPITFADLGRPRLGTCLRAAYLLDADSTSNTQGAMALLNVFKASPEGQDLVPVKIMVRIDDARDAEEFRRRAMSNPTRSVIVDTFGPQQVTCQRIADLAERAMPSVIVLAGTGPLATTMLDELAQTVREGAAGGTPAPSVPVVVIGPGATSVVDDHSYRQRWYDNSPLEVRPVEGPVNETKIVAAVRGPQGWCGRLGARLGNSPVARPFVVDCRGHVEGALLAHRCMQRWPLGTALYQDPAANGVEPTSGVQGLHRFSLRLLRDGNLPEDRWLRAARIMHERYLNEYGIQADSAGAQPWEVLSDFYRMSNLRALTHAMHLVSTLENKRVWRPASDAQQPEIVNDDEYDKIVSRLEHEDWKAYYERGGWEYAAVRDDAGRKHPLLVNWDGDPRVTPEAAAKIRQKSEDSARGAFALLAALGYQPYPAEPAKPHLAVSSKSSTGPRVNSLYVC